MYIVRVNYDGAVIHNPSIGLLLNNPKLVLEDNCAGSFEFDMSPDHPGFSGVIRFKSEISVYRDGVEIWAGRPIEESVNFYGVKHVYCEGLLSALYDTIQVPGEYHDTSVYSFLDIMLKAHNAQVTPTYRYRPFFYVGSVEFEDELYRYTNYETTLECIQDKLVSRLGGHLSMSRRDAFRFDLNYRKGYGKTSDQVIRFGQNLLDYTKNFDASELATVIVPLGARLEGQSDIQALEKYLDVSSVNGGSIYVRNESLVSTYGVCVKVVHWDDVTVPENLLTKAQQYLAEAQYDNMQLEVKAVDFHLADENVPAIDLLDEIRVVSPPHDLDRYFPVTKMEIPLDNPEDTILTLGTAVKTSLTSQSNARSTAIKELVDNYVPPSVILETAKDQATRLIKSGELGGHVVVLENEIYITDNTDISKAKKMWRWNSAGLGYTTGGKNGTYGTAITMDGKIVADYITAGTMKADMIKGGNLKLGGGSYRNGALYVYNSSGQEIGHWDKDGLTVTKGTIRGTSIIGSSIESATIEAPNINLGYNGLIGFGYTGTFSDGAKISRGGIYIGPTRLYSFSPVTELTIDGLYTNGKVEISDQESTTEHTIEINSEKISFNSIWDETGAAELINLKEIARIGIENSDEFTINAPKGYIHLKTNYGIKVYSGSTDYTGYSGTMTINSKSCRFVKGFLVSVT